MNTNLHNECGAVADGYPYTVSYRFISGQYNFNHPFQLHVSALPTKKLPR